MIRYWLYTNAPTSPPVNGNRVAKALCQSCQTCITIPWVAVHPGGYQRVCPAGGISSEQGRRVVSDNTKRSGRICTSTWGNGVPSVCRSAADMCVIVTFMQPLPLLQQPCCAGSTRLTFPVQEQRCHPMPPVPNSNSISVESVTIMCDSRFIPTDFFQPYNGRGTVLLPTCYFFSTQCCTCNWNLGSKCLFAPFLHNFLPH